MVDRFLVWLSAGILTAGLSAATIAGASLSAAEDGAASGAGGDTTSQSSNPTGAEQDSEPSDDSTADDSGVEVTAPVDDAEVVEDEASDPDVTDEDEATEDEEGAAEEAADDEESGSDGRMPARTFLTARDSAETSSGTERSAGALESDPKRDIDIDAEESEESEKSKAAATVADAEAMRAAAYQDDIATTLDTESEPAAASFAMAAPEEEPAQAPTLINVIGSFFFGIFQTFSTFIAGPPHVPPGSTVRVQRSTLELDCGPGYTVDSDWYFPDTEEPSTRLIYLQHGFPGSASEYDYTAAELAERNNAIVVATSISGNLFDCYSCHLGGDPMHAAVANLFLGDRDDLLASAKAAGFEGDALPQRFVLMGHSGGGQLSGGAAGYFEQFAPDEEDQNLAGVILFDTSPIGGAVERGLAKIPDDIPVYTISAEPNYLSSFGSVNDLLTTARPGQFVGVQLVGGMHSDSLQTHNLFVQFFSSLVGAGFSRPENVQAVQELAQSWINDWYEGTDTGAYGELGSTIDIPGTDGARAHVLPAPEHQFTIVDLIVDTALRSTLFVNVFAQCAEDPSATATATSCSA